MPGDKVRIITGQEERGARDVVPLAHLGPGLERRPRLGRGVRISLVKERGQDGAGANCVDADPVGAELDGGRLREVHHRRLCRRIGLRPVSPTEACDRGGVDDRAALALRDHDARRVLDPQKDAAHEHGKGVVPAVDLELGDRAKGAAEAGVVEHDVEAAKAFARPPDQCRDVGLRRDVDPHTLRSFTHSRRGDGLDEILVVGLVEVADDDTRALFEESRHRGSTHPAGAAGHHCNLSVQASRHLLISLRPSYTISPGAFGHTASAALPLILRSAPKTRPGAASWPPR